ncbi:hypothetical protein [Caballeronia sp. ATUFL_F2_KS9A]|uniref:gp53-like domain-containing protein n=1 Tax=Caballeronia sp. ATUFL_F2_KS9A TaxID=2921777 RepID=UPI0020288E03|nr:hypothetical protein [Caballeronia sp. ATUFL_F2_KS9A]
MTNIVDQDQWEAGIYQYETSDPVEGGPDGIDNKPLKQLANRTKYLFNRIAEIFNVAKAYSLAGGTANAITASYAPVVTARVDGMVLRFKAASANTGATTFTPNATDAPIIAPSPIYGLDHAPLTGGEIVVNGLCAVQWNSALNSGNGAWVLIENSAGIRKGVTPAQFVSDTSIATMAALQQALGNYAGLVGAVSQTLTPASVGSANIQIASAASTQVLPLCSSIARGAAIDFVNQTNVNMTINRQGTDTISVNGSALTTLTLQPGEAVTLISNGTNGWYAFGGNLMNRYSSQFTASLVGSGYQKLPSGLIIQWMNLTSSASADTPVTWPIAFPTACLNVVVTPNNNGFSFATQYNQSKTGCLLNNWTTSGSTPSRMSGGVQLISIGY